MMEFYNYFAIILDDDGNIKNELMNVSEVDVKCLEDGGISVCVLSSAMYIDELYELFKPYNGTFFLMNIDDNDKIAYNITDEGDREHLFSEIERSEATTNESSNEDDEEKTLSRDERINKILDKGKNNLSDSDKRLLNRLTRNNKKKDSDE